MGNVVWEPMHLYEYGVYQAVADNYRDGRVSIQELTVMGVAWNADSRCHGKSPCLRSCCSMYRLHSRLNDSSKTASDVIPSHALGIRSAKVLHPGIAVRQSSRTSVALARCSSGTTLPNATRTHSPPPSPFMTTALVTAYCEFRPSSSILP